MGFFDALFGKKDDYPVLDATNTAHALIESVRAELDDFVARTNDRIEVVPLKGEAYMFLGRPPKEFGVAWIQDGKHYNFKSLLQNSGVSEAALQKLAVMLRQAYEKHEQEPRYSLEVSGKKIVITPSKDFGAEVRDIIAKVVEL